MPKKEKVQKEPEEGMLVSAAKAIGKTAGKIASAAGVSGEAPHPARKHAKLPKKGKARLPRRQKKAQKKQLAG